MTIGRCMCIEAYLQGQHQWENYSWNKSETKEGNNIDWEDEEEDVLADWEDEYFLKNFKSSRQKQVKGKEYYLKRTNCKKRLINNQGKWKS